MRWALEAKRWSEVLRPRLWKAFAKCEGAGMHADKLGVLRTRIKKLETKWKLVCEYRNGLALAPTAKAASVDPFKTGASGRPSAASLVEAEAERRIANGEVAPREDDLAKFFRDLAAWWEEKRRKYEPVGPPMKPRSIENVRAPAVAPRP